MSIKTGDTTKFIKLWNEREETDIFHWTKSKPKNQVQFAFRNHWEVFQKLLENPLHNGGKRSLEVGAGRGALSAYFADNGFNATLLDVSPKALTAAEKNFKQNNLRGNFVVGNANQLPFNENQFDIVFSIGLLEHFEKPEQTISEQIRVLASGGVFIGYIVPEYTDNVQKNYHWLNQILAGYVDKKATDKSNLYRSNSNSTVYQLLLKNNDLQSVRSRGIYSVPMISHSIEFPFSLMPQASEESLLLHFEEIFDERKKKNDEHPWLCQEGEGQAFIVWGYKK